MYIVSVVFMVTADILVGFLILVGRWYIVERS